MGMQVSLEGLRLDCDGQMHKGTSEQPGTLCPQCVFVSTDDVVTALAKAERLGWKLWTFHKGECLHLGPCCSNKKAPRETGHLDVV